MSQLRKQHQGSFFNYLFIVYCIIWDALRVFFVSVDGYGRAGMLLLLLALLFNFNDKSTWRIFRISSVFIWFSWCVIEYLRWKEAGLLWRGMPDNWYFSYYNFIRTFFAMYISIVEMRRNSYKYVLIVLCSFVAYTLLGVIIQGSTGFELRGSEGNLLGNELPLMSVAMVAVAMISHYTSGIKKKTVWLLFGLCIIASLMCATRKAMGGAIILMVIWYLNISDLRDSRTVFSIIMLCIFAYLGYEYIMNNTTMGERFSEVEDQSYGAEVPVWLKWTGDRAFQYLLAWELFLRNPIWGIGLLNFQHYTGYNVQLHTEYMVQLAECGLVGFTLFLMFYISIFRRISLVKRFNKNLWRACIGWMLCIIFLDFTAWSFNNPCYFILFGIVIGTPDVFSRKKSNKIYCIDCR